MASPQKKPEPEASNPEEASTSSQPTKTGMGEQMPDESGYYEGLKVTTPDKREGFGKAIIHVFIAAAVFGGALYLYWEKVQRDETVHNLAAEARGMYLGDNYRDLIEAEKLLDEALDLNSRHRFSIATKGLINAYLWHDHGEEERRSVAEEYTSLAEDRGAHLQERYGARGLLLAGSGEQVEAERLLIEDVINEGGIGPAIFGSVGMAQRLQGKRTDARGSLRRAAEGERRSPRFNYWIAHMYFEGEDYRNTASSIERALDVNPDHIPSLILRSRVQIALGHNVEEAKGTIEETLARTDRELSSRMKAFALVAQAEHQNHEGLYEEAVASADEALDIAPNLADAHVIKGIAMIGAEQDGAVASIREGLDMFEFMPRAYHEAALALMESEQLEEARELMVLWGDRVTRNAPYHLAFGNLLLEGEDTEGAKEHFETAIELSPRTAEAHYQLGNIVLADEELEDEERLEAAKELFEEAINVRSRYPEVHEAMGWIYLEMGEWADGLRHFVQAINHYQTQDLEREKLHDLRRDVGDTLRRARQRRLAQAWLQESRDLIH